jgi:hypothetical protein
MPCWIHCDIGCGLIAMLAPDLKNREAQILLPGRHTAVQLSGEIVIQPADQSLTSIWLSSNHSAGCVSMGLLFLQFSSTSGVERSPAESSMLSSHNNGDLDKTSTLFAFVTCP